MLVHFEKRLVKIFQEETRTANAPSKKALNIFCSLLEISTLKQLLQNPKPEQMKTETG